MPGGNQYTSGYGLRYAFRSQGLGGLGAALVQQSIIPMVAAITVGFEQMIDKLDKRLDKQVQTAYANVANPQQLLAAWQKQLDTANITGSGFSGMVAPTKRGGGEGIIGRITGQEVPGWAQALAHGIGLTSPGGILEGVANLLVGNPVGQAAAKPANLDDAVKKLVHDRPQDAVALMMMGAPGADKIREELLRQKVIGQQNQLWNTQYGMSPYALQPSQYAAPTQVVINTGILGSAQDAQTILRRTDRNNGAGSVYTSPSRP